MEVRDADELEAALGEGVVTPERYAQAWTEAERIRKGFRSGAFESAVRTPAYLAVATDAARR